MPTLTRVGLNGSTVTQSFRHPTQVVGVRRPKVYPSETIKKAHLKIKIISRDTPVQDQASVSDMTAGYTAEYRKLEKGGYPDWYLAVHATSCF